MVSERKTRKASKKAQLIPGWIIAIPSYKRAETLRDKTLTVLKEYGIPKSKIHVFVASPAEYKIYAATLDPDSYGHLHIAKPGMAVVRNCITESFAVGQQIFNMDDDIRGFIEYSAGAKRNEKRLTSLTNAIETGFRDAKKSGFRLFGFYPVANGYFMKDAPPTEDLRYIIGSVWGIINPGLVELKVTIDDKEDYLRSVIMYVLDGGVLRYGNIAPQSAYYKEPGGMQEERTMARISESAKAMVGAFPDLVKINLTKKSGMPEVRLRDSRPVEDRSFGPSALSTYCLPHLRKGKR